MRKICSVSVWLVGMIVASAGLGRADEAGICSSISLRSTSASAEKDPSAGFGALEEQFFRRIERLSEVAEPATPVFYRSDSEGVALEIAGLSCAPAIRFAQKEILGGYFVELSVAGERLVLNMDSVAKATRGPMGNLQVSLTPYGRDRLKELTANNIGREMVVTVEGIGKVETIQIPLEIASGRIQLQGQALPEALTQDLDFALPVSANTCVPQCRSGYAWTYNGKRYSYKPGQ